MVIPFLYYRYGRTQTNGVIDREKRMSVKSDRMVEMIFLHS